ncbi:MAG: hypothetical protein BBJ57_10195 [Desulfobacterales bacterium PC51MH44]|nr:MAG: hypothetical protein BBJ57_10195 [Desulfobacterales bacterium PC51MH44]
MKDKKKTKEQLINELAVLHQRVNELEASGPERRLKDEDFWLQHRVFQLLDDFDSEISHLNLDHVIGRALDFIKKRLEISRVSIALFENDRKRFQVLDIRSDIDGIQKGPLLTFNSTVLSEVVEGDKPIYRSDIRKEKTNYQTDAKLIAEGIRSDFLIPLIVENTCIGTLNVGSMKVDGISEEERHLLALLASKIALTLRNTQLFEALQKANSELEVSVAERTDELTRANKKLKLGVKESRLVEKKLAELSVFPEMNPAPVIKADQKGRILLLNRYAQELFTKEDLVLKPWKAICPECEETGFPQALSSKETLQHECRISDKHFLFTYKKVPDSDRVYIFGTDITDRRRAEKEIAELSVFPEMNPAPVIKVDPKGTILLCNRSARKLFKRDNLLGKPWTALCLECEEAGILQLLNSKDTVQHECCIMDKHFLFTYKKVPDSELVFIFGADITDRKRAEELLQRAHDELERRVEERTAELMEAKEDLLQALSEVEQLKNRLQAENVYLQEEIKLNHNFEEIIGQSNAIKKVLGKVEQVAATNATVLILGETGTGKELFARAIHNLSSRNDRPLVKVNCAALQPSLIESELFGHEKGAFTGAFSQRNGRFELANNGTIFLDEIGDLTLELQSKLLRVIQEGEFERLGGSRTIEVDVRIIAATHEQLEERVKAGRFREDLYYRLNVFPILLPPLRKRKKDISFLTMHFFNKYCTQLGKTIDNIPQKAMSALNAYRWSGNVRELENIIERAVILTRGTSLQLDESILGALQKGSPKSATAPTLDEVQRNYILRTLEEANWKIEGKQSASERLAINPSTLRSRIRKLGIKKP